MTNNELPDLSAWHRVPVGAIIPKGVPYACTYEGGLNVELDGYSRDKQVRVNSHYTEHPIAPPLPTEEGATIIVSHVPGGSHPPHTLLTREDGRWVNRLGMECRVDQIRAWAPVTIGETVVAP